MPIKKIKAQSPDPYLGKIAGDTELARLAHLNHLIDQINAQGGGGTGGGSITVNGNSDITDITIGPLSTTSVGGGSITLTIDPYPGYRVYRAKIATQTIDWPGYGYLYNWYAVDDARGLANPSGGTGLIAPNEWRVPSNTDWDTLDTFAGGTGVSGFKLKSELISDAYPFYGWFNTAQGIDNYNFNGLPGSFRDEFGYFNPLIGILGVFWTSNSVGIPAIARTLDGSQNLGAFSVDKGRGNSIRLVREATASELLLPDGSTSNNTSLDPYTGNDGKTYVTVKIGTQIWLAQNLRETKYNDNSDIFNASLLFGGDVFSGTWQAKGAAQEGAWTAYMYTSGNTSYFLKYDPEIITIFYNDVLENTFGENLVWVATLACTSCDPVYNLQKASLRPFGKTHIKITPAHLYDTSYTEKSILVEDAQDENTNLAFYPFKRTDAGVFSREDLNNYVQSGYNNRYVYVEILEYAPAYYGSGLFAAVGASNLEDEEEIVALTYEINGVTYTEDLEAKKHSIEIAKIYEQLGIFDKYKV
jgi:uncharacterized protein (TIGR02145 family)